jgi:hypothetical protein
VTDREGDIDDMARLVQSGNFDWSIVWDELDRQERDTANPVISIAFYEQIENLYEQTGILPPFYRKLIRKVTDNYIEKSVRKDGIYLDKLISLLKDAHDITEKRIRNRIDVLQRRKRLKKVNTDRGIKLIPRKGNILNSCDKLLENIHSIAIRLNLPTKIERRANDIAVNVSTDPKFEGLRPKNVAASIVYLTSQICDEHITGDQISRVTNVSQPSIYSRAKDIREFLTLNSSNITVSQ